MSVKPVSAAEAIERLPHYHAVIDARPGAVLTDAEALDEECSRQGAGDEIGRASCRERV